MDDNGQLQLDELRLRRLMPVPSSTVQAECDTSREEAYARVMEGYAAALKVPGLPDDEHAALVRQYQLAARAAGRPPLALAPGRLPGQAAV